MFGLSGFWLYLFIFCGKMIEVAFSTLRITLAGKGQKILGALAGFVEIILWVFIASSVLKDVQSDPWKMVAYCLAFACGIVMGTWLEQMLAVGLTSIQIVVPAEEAEELGKKLRDSGFGVTILDGRSVDGTERAMVFIQLRRKHVSQAMALARREAPNAVISISDVRSVSGGYIR